MNLKRLVLTALPVFFMISLLANTADDTLKPIRNRKK